MRGFLPANLFFKMCLVLRVFDAYQMRKKIFFLLGLPFTPPYLRIYEGIFASRFSAGGDGHKHHLKNIFLRWVDFDPLKCPDIWKDFSSAQLNTGAPA